MAQPPPRTLSSNTLACVNWVIDRVALGSDSPGDDAGGEGGGGPPVVNSFNPKTSFGDDQQFIIADFVEDPSKPCLFIWWDPEDTTNGSKCLDEDVALNTMFESDPLFLPLTLSRWLFGATRPLARGAADARPPRDPSHVLLSPPRCSCVAEREEHWVVHPIRQREHP